MIKHTSERFNNFKKEIPLFIYFLSLNTWVKLKKIIRDIIFED